MRVRLSYADQEAILGHVLMPVLVPTPYEGIEFSVEGDIDTVAVWIDEHLETFQCAINNEPYRQGASVPHITKCLEEGGIQEFGNIAYFVEHIGPC